MALSNAFSRDLRQAFRLLDDASLFLGPHRSLAPSYGLFNNPSRFFDEIARAPASSVKEDADKYIVEAIVPGYKKQDIKVEFENNGETLHITGTKASKVQQPTPSSENASEAASTQNGTPQSSDLTTTGGQSSEVGQLSDQTSNWAYEQYAQGQFTSTFRFPPGTVDVDKVQASLEDGILRLTINKVKKAEGRRLVEVA